jgi:hypothetical protein
VPAGLVSTEVYASQDVYFFSFDSPPSGSTHQPCSLPGGWGPPRPYNRQDSTPRCRGGAHTVSIRQQPSAYASIRQRTPAYVSIREGSGPPPMWWWCAQCSSGVSVCTFVLVKQANREPDGCPTPNDDSMRALMCEYVYCCTSKVLVPCIKSTNTDTWWLPHAE